MRFEEPEQVESLFAGMGFERYTYSDAPGSSTVEIESGDLLFRFDYDRAAVMDINQISGAHWNPDRKVWIAEPTRWNLRQILTFLRARGFTFEIEVVQALKRVSEL